MVGIIPLLHTGSIDTLTKIEDKVAYLIRFVLLNPGNTSSILEHEMVSFRVLEATYGKDKNVMANALRAGLKACMQDYLDEGDSIQVEVTAYDIDSINYGLNIQVIDAFGNNILSTANVRVVDNSIDIKFNSK